MTILSGQSVISRVYTSRFGNGTARLEPRPKWYYDLDLLGMKVLKAAECALASLIFSTTVSTEVPKSSEGGTGASRRKPFSFLSRSAKFTHRCFSITTMAAIDLPIAETACLVARRAKSVVPRSSATRSVDKP